MELCDGSPAVTVIKATSSNGKPCCADLSQTLALPIPRTADYSRLTALLTAQARLLTSSDMRLGRGAPVMVVPLRVVGVAEELDDDSLFALA